MEASEKAAALAAKPRAAVMGEKEVAAVPGKRKREALVDVTEVNKKKAIIAAKGKAKAVDKTTTAASSSTSTASVSTTVGTRQTSKTSAVDVPRRRVLGDLKPPKEEQEEEEEKPEVATAVPPQFNLRSAGAVRRNLKVLRDDVSEEGDAPAARVFSKPTGTGVLVKVDESHSDEETVAAHLAHVEEEEVIPHDDLDANDWDDPTMCAEYADEIFDYMKVIEVSNYLFNHLLSSFANLFPATLIS